MKPRVLTEVHAEIGKVADWYESQRDGLGDEFHDEYEIAMRKIEAAPQSFPRLETTRTKRDVRRCVLHRFPYVIVFEVLATEVVILAVAHGSRRPNYFLRRKP